MPLFSFEGASPKVHPDAWIAPTATLIGNVIVEARASVWYGAVLRADFGPIVLREGANVQDNSVIHVGEQGCELGKGATVGHSCVLHDCSVGTNAVIGNGAIVQDRASVGSRTLVGAGALIPPNAVVPDESLALGAPAKKFQPLTESARAWVEHNEAIYTQLADRHRSGISPVTE
ncbi:carbonic anhydrase/acetyltransferase-like protein (isoleucine patch superfamily) [Tamaricihabitans halophyticus]|uniref:Carbonic anhydrase/acetyltransferase-like protein (Isoleucine patch superfamily) n=1 Tax=Tamaricihabitans halophyticus TaxID=1262583 RepID=A0A4V2STS4_9PSEU|nr:gamma carbonic anhydrase family protein [Tamaricihabitans halophyticus]TCP51856.1 carbonic anhydrase/acetyltransferase-like protein (isoleucine patch superfamily) [Tamaricihabitans halophyticus]